MRALVISHSCVVDVNQKVFVTLHEREGVEVGLLTPGNWRSEYTGEAMTPGVLPEVRFPVWKAPVVMPGHVSLHFYSRLPWKELRRFAPDVLLSTQEPWSLSGLQALWLSQALKAPMAFQTNQNILKRYLPPFRWIEAATYRRSALALAYSEEARQVLIRKGLAIPSVVVPYATDISQFQPQDASALRRQLGLEGCVVVGYLGRIVPEKGLDTLVRAMARLARGDGDCGGNPVKALIVGAGSAEGALRELIAAENLRERFVFTGVVPHSEAAKYMSCLDIFVLPSRTTPAWKEQFGRVIIEALACHVPVIGSDSGQIPHLIRDTGGGSVFREGDDQDLAQNLALLVRDRERRLLIARQSAAVVRERYSCEAVAAQLHRLFRQMTRTDPVEAPIVTEGLTEKA